jgi:H+/Cl- antiporter ClcA
MNNQQSLIQFGLRWGLISGLAGVIMYTLVYAINRGYLVSFAVGAIMLLITIGLLVYPVYSYRKSNGGFMEFKDAFLLCLVIFASSSLISTVYQFLLYNIIDPTLPEFIRESTLQKTVAMMEKFGADSEAIDKTTEELQNQDFNFSGGRLAQSYFLGLLFGAFISLIVGAIFRKQPKTPESI